jgi:hypothetical protein
VRKLITMNEISTSSRKTNKRKEKIERESRNRSPQSKQKRQRHRKDLVDNNNSNNNDDDNSNQNNKKNDKKNNNQNDEKKHNASDEKDDLSSNRLLRMHQQFLHHEVLQTEYKHYFCNDENRIDMNRRSYLWMKQYELGETCINQYSWAIPTIRAMKVLQYYSPLIEIGCGTNAYWCQQMLSYDPTVDIIGYDINIHHGGIIHPSPNKSRNRNDIGSMSSNSTTASRSKMKKKFQVRYGGPEVLKDPNHQNRTLFLCYPDDYENNDEVDQNHLDNKKNKEQNDSSSSTTTPTSMAYQCLQHYIGQYIIHVGELYTQSSPTLSMEQAPWGRTSSPEFQQLLAQTFHCILRISLPNWFHTVDTLTVWKRSEVTTIVYESDTNDEDEDDDKDATTTRTGNDPHHRKDATIDSSHSKKKHDKTSSTKVINEKEEKEVDEVQFRYIPLQERLPMDAVAPCLQHLYDQLPSPPSMTFRNDDVKNTKDQDDTDGLLSDPIDNNNAVQNDRNNLSTAVTAAVLLMNQKNNNMGMSPKNKKGVVRNGTTGSSLDLSLDDEKYPMRKKKHRCKKKNKKERSSTSSSIDTSDYQSPW